MPENTKETIHYIHYTKAVDYSNQIIITAFSPFQCYRFIQRKFALIDTPIQESSPCLILLFKFNDIDKRVVFSVIKTTFTSIKKRYSSAIVNTKLFYFPLTLEDTARYPHSPRHPGASRPEEQVHHHPALTLPSPSPHSDPVLVPSNV